MSYTVKTTVTKPTGTKWFAEIHPGLARRFRRIDRVRAVGLENSNIEKLNDDTIVITSVWADESAYRNYITKKGNSIADGVRKEYNDRHGISLSTEIL